MAAAQWVNEGYASGFVQGNSRSCDPSIEYCDGWDYFVVSYTRHSKIIGRNGFSRGSTTKRVVRDTDEAGAQRFAKKWGIACPTRDYPGGR